MNIADVIAQDELEKGFTPIRPGMAPWFPVDDWHPGDCCSTDGKIVRMITLIARNPGTGAFRRLVDNIQDHGMTPVIIEPLGIMPEIMRKWGWQPRLVGAGFSRERQFWPPESSVK